MSTETTCLFLKRLHGTCSLCLPHVLQGHVVTSHVTREAPEKQNSGSLPMLTFLWGVYMRAKSLQSCLTLCDSMDCSPPGSSVHGILQARILEWVAMPSSRGSSHPPQESNQHLLNLLHWQAGSLPLPPPGKPFFGGTCPNSVKHTTFLCKYSLGSPVPKVVWVSFGDSEATCPQEESSQPLAFLIPGRFYRGRASPSRY